MLSRLFSSLAILGLGLLLSSCGQGGRPSEKGFFLEPQPVITGKAMQLPSHQGGDHHDDHEDDHGDGHRTASLQGINLVPAPEGTVIHLNAVDAMGVTLSGTTEVTAEVGIGGAFEFFSLPNRCVTNDPQAKGCVAGASPNLLLSMGEAGKKLRAFVTFQKDEIIDPLTEATVQAIAEGSKDLSHFGPTRLPQLLEKTRKDLEVFQITPEMDIKSATTAMRGSSLTLQGMTGSPPITRVSQTPSTILPNSDSTVRLEALGYSTKDTCTWSIPGGQFVNSLVNNTVVDPHGACVVYVRLRLAQTTDFQVSTSRKLGQTKSLSFKVSVSP